MISPQRITIDGAGVELAADEYGGAGQPVVFLHGGGQTRHAWGGAAARFAAAGYHTFTVDLRGHGDSEWAPNGSYRIDDFAADVRRISDALDTPAVFVGASLGGLSSMVAIGEDADQAELAAGLILVDITPRIESEGREHVRSFMKAGMQGFDSLEAAADAVAAYLPHRPRPKDLSGLQKNLRLRGGRLYWHWDPRWIQNSEGVDGQSGFVDHRRLQDAARAVTVPTMLVRGQMSDIVSDEGVRELQALMPQVSVIDVSGAGHMVAGDQNDAFNDAVAEFLRRLTP